MLAGVVHESAPKRGEMSKMRHKVNETGVESGASRGGSVVADVAESVCEGRGHFRRPGERKVEPLQPWRTIRGAKFVKPKHSARRREVPNRVVGKSEIDETFPEGKPLRASGSTGPGVTVRSAHAAQSPPMLAKGSTLKTTDTYPPHTHNIRKHVQRGACITPKPSCVRFRT